MKNKLVTSREFSAAINTTELKALFTSAPDAQAVSRTLLAAIPAVPADNELLPSVAKAAVKRFAQDADPTTVPLPAGTIRGYSGYLFRRSAAIMCSTIQGQSRVADFQPLLNGQRKMKASDLALQEFQYHHTDCSDSAGIWRISFDAAGNATVTGSGVKLNYTAAEMTGALNGTPIEDAVNKKKISFSAYGLPASFNSTNTVLVQKVVVAGTPGESVTAFSQP
ncbi:hypothetical protein [Pseudoduganella violacea]|uniref:Uncharacterized protein n=1 Tax=Pseudoduganella violacea TaxID=1715466 RepID=A0A7W5FWQ0_9BURK|nr:hypothetical protein [Pseudoduganella violacea]MBB3122076.1 hypothetical protein [Pseudoduganella violacea]